MIGMDSSWSSSSWNAAAVVGLVGGIWGIVSIVESGWLRIMPIHAYEDDPDGPTPGVMVNLEEEREWLCYHHHHTRRRRCTYSKYMLEFPDSVNT